MGQSQSMSAPDDVDDSFAPSSRSTTTNGKPIQMFPTVSSSGYQQPIDWREPGPPQQPTWAPEHTRPTYHDVRLAHHSNSVQPVPVYLASPDHRHKRTLPSPIDSPTHTKRQRIEPDYQTSSMTPLNSSSYQRPKQQEYHYPLISAYSQPLYQQSSQSTHAYSPPQPSTDRIGHYLGSNHVASAPAVMQDPVPAQRPAFDWDNVPTGPRVPSLAVYPSQFQPIAEWLRRRPHVFISSAHLPVITTFARRLETFLRKILLQSARMFVEYDDFGWYILFAPCEQGERDCRLCFELNKDQMFFDKQSPYTLRMQCFDRGYPAPEQPISIESSRLSDTSRLSVRKFHPMSADRVRKDSARSDRSSEYQWDKSDHPDSTHKNNLAQTHAHPQIQPASCDAAPATVVISSEQRHTVPPASPPPIQLPPITTRLKNGSVSGNLSTLTQARKEGRKATITFSLKMRSTSSSNEQRPGVQEKTNTLTENHASESESVSRPVSPPPLSWDRRRSAPGSEPALRQSASLMQTLQLARLSTPSRSDEAMSVSSGATPSETSSSSILIGRYCEKCKKSQIPSYNPKVPCGSCSRWFHEACRKLQPTLTEGNDVWQCHHCKRKKRPLKKSLKLFGQVSSAKTQTSVEPAMLELPGPATNVKSSAAYMDQELFGRGSESPEPPSVPTANVALTDTIEQPGAVHGNELQQPDMGDPPQAQINSRSNDVGVNDAAAIVVSRDIDLGSSGSLHSDDDMLTSGFSSPDFPEVEERKSNESSETQKNQICNHSEFQRNFTWKELIGMALVSGPENGLFSREVCAWIQTFQPTRYKKGEKWESSVAAVLCQRHYFTSNAKQPGERACRYTLNAPRKEAFVVLKRSLREEVSPDPQVSQVLRRRNEDKASSSYSAPGKTSDDVPNEADTVRASEAQPDKTNDTSIRHQPARSSRPQSHMFSPIKSAENAKSIQAAAESPSKKSSRSINLREEATSSDSHSRPSLIVKFSRSSQHKDTQTPPSPTFVAALDTVMHTSLRSYDAMNSTRPGVVSPLSEIVARPRRKQTFGKPFAHRRFLQRQQALRKRHRTSVEDELHEETAGGDYNIINGTALKVGMLSIRGDKGKQRSVSRREANSTEKLTPMMLKDTKLISWKGKMAVVNETIGIVWPLEA